MRFAAIALVLSLALASAAQADCKDELPAAFEKQRTSPAFRMVVRIVSDAGPTTMTIDYKQPDRMRRVLEAPGRPTPVQTILVGTKAWSNETGSFELLSQEAAEPIIAHARSMLVDAPQIGDYVCLGKVSVDGKEYLGYRMGSAEDQASPTALIRTVYVDPVLGLPALNVLTEGNRDAEPTTKAVYSYPTDIEIEAFGGGPASEQR